MKQLIIYGLLYILMTMVPSFSYGQKVTNPQSDTVRWDYGRGENKLRSSESLSISGHLISYGGQQIVWIQNGTDRKYTFDIKSVRGEWLNGNEIGELVFRAVCNGVDGTIRIYRDAREVAIQIDFSTQDKLTPNVLLPVNSFRKI